jgi:hypothetical protein
LGVWRVLERNPSLEKKKRVSSSPPSLEKKPTQKEMSTKQDLLDHPSEFVLYYCGVTNNDGKMYNDPWVEVCNAHFDVNQNFVVDAWFIVAYTQPDAATLLSYDLNTVLTWYDVFYTKTLDIQSKRNSTAFTTSELTTLAAVQNVTNLGEAIVYNSTTNKYQYYNGSAFVNLI